MTSSSARSGKTFFVENLGCSKNQVDAESMVAALEGAGWSHQEDPAEAELIIINTCGFIESAKEESIQTIFDYRRAYPEQKILAAGCFAQRYNKEILNMIPELDGVFGNRAVSRVAEAATPTLAGEKPVFTPPTDLTTPSRKKLMGFKGSVYLKIAEGCNHHCHFCAIPSIRGSLKSRSIEEILEEFEGLLAQGVVEVNLVAQDLANFGEDRGQRELKDLLERMAEQKGDFWIRLLYIHPDCFPWDVLPLIKRDPRFLPYFDIPFQHADREVLQGMGRRGDRRTYIELIQRLRREFPQGVIRSTLLLGYPGENDTSFLELKAFLEEAQLDWAGFFSYSREEGTKAYHYKQLRGESKKKNKKRLATLEELQHKISEKRMERFVGQTLEVLVEEPIQGEPLYLGRAYLQAPEVDGLVLIRSDKTLQGGELLPVRIVKRNALDLEGIIPA